MDILFVTPALAPYSVDPGAADVCNALPKVLRGLGHKVTVVTPLPEEGLPAGSAFSRRLDPVRVDIGGQQLSCPIYDGRTPGGVDVVFLEHRDFEDLYEEDQRGLHAQALFGKAVAELYRDPGSFETAHVHGEEAALACVYLAKAGKLPTIMSVHDATDPLRFTPKVAAAAGAGDVADGELCPLIEAVRAASHVTTDAPARNLATRRQAKSVGDAMEARGGDLSAVLSGLDHSVWNPATDPLLFARYTPVDLSGKARSKSMLQRELGLEVDPDVILLGAIEGAAGAGRLERAAAEITRADVQVVVQVLDEDAECLDDLIELSDRFPDRLQVRIGDSQRRTHRILAGCDALLMTSDRPAMAMAAQRYGTVPVASRNSLSAECIVDLDAKLQTGNGIVYDDMRAPSLLAAARRAQAAFDQRAPLERVRRLVMQRDHSWDRSARRFENLYLNLAQAAH